MPPAPRPPPWTRCRRWPHAQHPGAAPGQAFSRPSGLHRGAGRGRAQALDAHGRPDKLLMSFHGLPRFTLERGDPYHCECQKTARLLAEALALAPDQYQLSFQSRFGRAEWLQPYTAATLAQWGQKTAPRRRDLPGFRRRLPGDAGRNRHGMQGRVPGGRRRGVPLIPCLNESDAWIQALAQIALEHVRGWDPARSEPARELRTPAVAGAGPGAAPGPTSPRACRGAALARGSQRLRLPRVTVLMRSCRRLLPTCQRA